MHLWCFNQLSFSHERGKKILSLLRRQSSLSLLLSLSLSSENTKALHYKCSLFVSERTQHSGKVAKLHAKWCAVIFFFFEGG